MTDRPIIVESKTEVDHETGENRITSIERPMTDEEFIGHQSIQSASAERAAAIDAAAATQADALATVERIAESGKGDVRALAEAVLTILAN